MPGTLHNRVPPVGRGLYCLRLIVENQIYRDVRQGDTDEDALDYAVGVVLSGRKLKILNPMMIRFAAKNANNPPTMIPCTTSATMVLLNMMVNILSRVSVKVAYKGLR